MPSSFCLAAGVTNRCGGSTGTIAARRLNVYRRITAKFSECERKTQHKSKRPIEHFAAIFCSSNYIRAVKHERSFGKFFPCAIVVNHEGMFLRLAIVGD